MAQIVPFPLDKVRKSKNDNLFDNVDLFIPNDVHDLNDREAYIIDLVDYISMYYSIRQEKMIVLFTNYK